MTMPTCPLCYKLKFKTWIEFHDHYASEHHLNLTDIDNKLGAEIRRRAIAEPLNVSGRTRHEIVSNAEATWLASSIL